MTANPGGDQTPMEAVTRRGPAEPTTHLPATRPVLFVTLAYAISWAWVIPLAVTGDTVVDGSGWPTHLPALLGPLLAATLCTALAGRRALRALGASMVRWRIGWRWWLAAVSPLLALVVVLGVLAVCGADLPAASEYARFSGIPAAWGLLEITEIIMEINEQNEKTN